MAASIRSHLSQTIASRAILTLCLAASLPTWSQGNWRSLSLPPSGSVTVMHAAGGNHLAGTSQGRIFVSGDGGRSWIPSLLSGGAPASAIRSLGSDLYAAFGVTGLDPFDCAPTGQTCIFPSRQGGLFRSLDQGRTWASFAQMGVSAMAIRGSDLYVANGAGLYRFAGGNPARVMVTWLGGGGAQPGTPLGRSFQAMEWVGNTLLALAAGNGATYNHGPLLRGVPSGDTLLWSLVRDSVPAMARLGTALLICKEEPISNGPPNPRVHRSLDAGVTWERLTAIDCRNMWASGSRLFVAVDGTALHISLDTGSTWQPWVPPVTGDFAIQAMVENAGSLHIGRAGSPSIQTLEAGAQAWKGSGEGLRDLPVTGILIHDGGVLAADVEGAYHLPTLASPRWQTPLLWSSRSLPGSLASTGDRVLALGDAFYHTRNPQDSVRWVIEEPQPVKALAAGDRWAAVWTEVITETESVNGLRVCVENGLPGCRSPARVNLPQPQFFPINQSTRNSLRGMAIQGDTLAVKLDSLYLSVDRGESFQSYPPPYNCSFLCFHGGSLFAGGSDSLRVWRGAGGWESVPLQGVQVSGNMQAMVSRPGALFLATASGVFRRADGRADWEDLSQGLPHLAVRSLDVEGSLVVVGLVAGGVWARELEPTRTRTQTRSKAPAPGYPGRYPAYRAASGTWKRIDGRPAAAIRP